MTGWIRCGGILLLCGIMMIVGYGSGLRYAQDAAETVTAAADLTDSAEDVIERFRTERQQLRQMQISQLNEIIYGSGTDASIITEAQARQLELMKWSEQEVMMEGILSLRGFDDVLATVHNGSVNIMLRTDVLNEQQTAVILDAVTRELKISAGNVKIIPIN